MRNLSQRIGECIRRYGRSFYPEKEETQAFSGVLCPVLSTGSLYLRQPYLPAGDAARSFFWLTAPAEAAELALGEGAVLCCQGSRYLIRHRAVFYWQEQPAYLRLLVQEVTP